MANMISATAGGLAFFDTNILVYQFDKNSPEKLVRARDLVDEYQQYDRGLISTQVVQEFMNVAVKKFDSALLFEDVGAVMDALLVPMLRHCPSPDFYRRTLDLFQTNTVSFYDCLIIQAAIDKGCDVLYSEDLQDGRYFGKLRVVNPFKQNEGGSGKITASQD